MNGLLRKLGIELPIVQAPMAGIATPALAAAVSRAGALGSLGVGNVDAVAARGMIAAVRARTDRPLNINVFCHRRATRYSALETAWLERLRPEFTRFGAQPPRELREIYQSFLDDQSMQALLLEERPAVVSFHFGLPDAHYIAALRDAGVVLLASATNLREARAIVAAGLDGVIAQGYEAGGHRGAFDENADDARLGTLPLVRMLAHNIDLPILAAGGIMDGAGIAACLLLGASAAQLGTAFIGCPESAADADYRAALFSPAAAHTLMTRTVSGRPARFLAGPLTALGADVPDEEVPAYPLPYDAAKLLVAAARAAGTPDFGPFFAGQGASQARNLPAGDLVAQLRAELQQSLQQQPSLHSAQNGP